jgi:hypothetical protein
MQYAEERIACALRRAEQDTRVAGIARKNGVT